MRDDSRMLGLALLHIYICNCYFIPNEMVFYRKGASRARVCSVIWRLRTARSIVHYKVQIWQGLMLSCRAGLLQSYSILQARFRFLAMSLACDLYAKMEVIATSEFLFPDVLTAAYCCHNVDSWSDIVLRRRQNSSI